MPESNAAHLWEQIQRLGVHPHVRSILQYELLAVVGAMAAEKFLSEYSPDHLAPDTCRVVHRLMFENIHPWAGDFRRPGESIIVAGYPGADSCRIRPELTLLQSQISHWPNHAVSPALTQLQSSAIRCAFYHARFERIHPFKDGNGRVGRQVLTAMVKSLSGEPTFPDWKAEMPFYFAGLKAANRHDLTPLANLILSWLSHRLIEFPFPAPFRMAPRMFEGFTDTGFESDFEWSLR
jgi:fido (protein-threonine AMPylation protein)